MDTPELSPSHRSPYKRSFDDLDTGGDAGTSGLGLPLLVAATGEEASRHDRHKRPRSQRNSPSHVPSGNAHISFDSTAHPQTVDTRTSTPSHHGAAPGLASSSSGLSHNVLEAAENTDVNMSFGFSGELQGQLSPSDAFPDSSFYSPPLIPSTQTSPSASGDVTPADLLTMPSTGRNDSHSMQASLSVFAPLQIPLPSTRAATSADVMANDNNVEDRFRLSMERFNAFDDHISILRYPNSEQEVSSAPPPVMSESSPNVTPSFHDLDDEAEWLEEPVVSAASAAPLTTLLSRSPSPVRSVASLSQLRGPREREAQNHGASETINHSERHSRVIEERRSLLAIGRSAADESSLPSPSRLRADAVRGSHTSGGREFLNFTDGSRQLVEQGVQWEETPTQRQPPRRPPQWVITGSSRTDRHTDDNHLTTSGSPHDASNTGDERTRNWIIARAREVARMRTGYMESQHSRASASLNERLGWTSQTTYGGANSRRAQQQEGDRDLRSSGDTSLPVMPVQSSLLTGRLDPDTSRHRRRDSDTDEAEAAWLFNEVENRYPAIGDSLFAGAPARARSSSSAQRVTYGHGHGPSTRLTSGASRDQIGTSGSDNAPHRLPMIPRMSLLDESDSDEETWGPLLPPGPDTRRRFRDMFPSSAERQHSQRPHWPGESLSEPETTDWLRPRHVTLFGRPTESLAMGDAADMYPPPLMNTTRNIHLSDTLFADMEMAQRRQSSRSDVEQDYSDEVWVPPFPMPVERDITSITRAEQVRNEMDTSLSRFTAITEDIMSLSADTQPRDISGLRPSRTRTEEAEVEALLSSNRSARSTEAAYATSESERSSTGPGRRDRSSSAWRAWELPSPTTAENELRWSRLHSRDDIRATAVPTTTSTEFRRFANIARNSVGTSNLSSANEFARRLDRLGYSEPVFSPFSNRRLSTGGHSSHRPDTATPASQPMQASRGGINLDQYHDGPFRASLARSERLRREREETRQRVTVNQDVQRHLRFSASTATSISADAPATTNGSGISRSMLASREPPSSTTDRAGRVRMIRPRHFHNQSLRNTREEQRELHDSVTRHVRTPAARLAAPDHVWESGGLPGLLPDAAANSTRQQQLIANFRAQRSAVNDSQGWGDINSPDHVPWRHPRSSRNAPPASRGPGEDGHNDRLTRTAAAAAAAQRRGWFIGTRRRMDRDGLRTFGDYVRDEDLDTSYEGLLRLSNLIGESRPRGTPRNVIDGLPSGVYSEWATSTSEQRCPICLDDYDQSDPVMKVSKCSHWFHKACLEQWLGTANTCPVCRGPVDPNAPSISSRARGTRARRGGLTRTALAPASAPTTDNGPDVEHSGGPANNNERPEDDLFDEEEHELLLRSLHLLTRRGG